MLNHFFPFLPLVNTEFTCNFMFAFFLLLYKLFGICCSSCIVFGISGLKINKYSIGWSFVGEVSGCCVGAGKNPLRPGSGKWNKLYDLYFPGQWKKVRAKGKKPESSIKYQVSSIKKQVSSIKKQVSSIKYQETSIKYQESRIKKPETIIKYYSSTCILNPQVFRHVFSGCEYFVALIVESGFIEFE